MSVLLSIALPRMPGVCAYSAYHRVDLSGNGLVYYPSPAPETFAASAYREESLHGDGLAAAGTQHYYCWLFL